MLELLRVLVEALVVNKEAIQLNEREDGDTTILEVKVAEEDMGRVIGRGGRRAQAIRTILKAKGRQEDRRVIVDILD